MLKDRGSGFEPAVPGSSAGAFRWGEAGTALAPWPEDLLGVLRANGTEETEAPAGALPAPSSFPRKGLGELSVNI